MLRLNLHQIAEMLSIPSHHEYENINILGISTDTRTTTKGDLFIPLLGPTFDGHDYIDQAIEKGAVAILSDTSHEISCEVPVLYVPDTLKALFQFAKEYRKYLDVTVIGITGSNGKTTTKDIITSLLKEQYKVVKTPQNLNNEIGLSKTILDLDADTDIAVLEMGIENFKEMSLLTDIACPDIAIITNIAESHLVNLKTKENVARAKLEILENLKPHGIFIYNQDDEILRKVTKEYNLPSSTVTYGTRSDAMHVITPIKYDETGNTFDLDGHIYTIPLLGDHQMYNGACSILVANIFQLDYSAISKGLKHIELTGMRNEMLFCNGFHILNDCYKSNPQSLNSALATVYGLQGYKLKIAVIGDMLELGESEIEIHQNIGDELNPEKINYLLTFGDLSKYIYQQASPKYPENHAFHFETKKELIDKLKELIVEDTLIMVKASHAMNFNDITNEIKNYTL